MADKVKGKKTKTLSKKPGTRVRKPEAADEVRSSSAIALQKKTTVSAKMGNRESSKAAEPTTENLVGSPSMNVSIPPLEQKFVETSDNRIDQALVKPQGKPHSPAFNKPESEAEQLSVRLSRSLLRKLKDQAQDEGISLEEFVSELLAESVVLRAWEIVERKNQMKGPGNSPAGNNRNAGPSGPHSPNRGQRGNKGSGGGGGGGPGGGGNRGMNPARYQNIMEDKATFLEYVRNQERNRR